MTSDERKTLEALANDTEAVPGAAPESIECAAAIRAALRDVDRLNGLRPEVGPFPPEGRGLPRYGIRWNGPGEPLAVPMPDGYWTPYHLALAEVDALTQQVATLNRDRALMHADRIIDAATIADLEARAIPKELLDTRRFEIELCWHPLVAGVVARYAKPMANGDWQVEWVSSPADAERVELFPTLSAALSAAKEAP